MKKSYSDSSSSHSSHMKQNVRNRTDFSHSHKEKSQQFSSNGVVQRTESAQSAYSFADAIALAAFNAGVKEQVDSAEPHCQLAVLPYETELEVKTEAVKAFWRVNNLPDELVKSIVPSPIGRPCRTTSKRRVFIDRKRRVRFTMGYSGTQRVPTIKSPLEPDSHGQIFTFLHDLLNTDAYFPLARFLNFIVIRGNYNHLAVIFNMFRIDAAAMRKIHAIADKLKSDFPIVRSMFTFLDETRSEFYLESKATTHPFHKIFGPEMLDVTVDDMKFLYPPGAFSQVNESILPLFLGKAVEMAALNDSITFYDLYCGYGLFGIFAAPKAARVIGVDFNGPAIQAASANAEHIVPKCNVRFIPSAVTLKSVTEDLPPEIDDEVFLLDPPRNGVAANVISSIAERNPLRVIHVFCSADEVPRSLRAWKSAGYIPVKAAIFDMFPGTPNVETMILLSKRPKKVKTNIDKSRAKRSGRKQSDKRTLKKSFFKHDTTSKESAHPKRKSFKKD